MIVLLYVLSKYLLALYKYEDQNKYDVHTRRQGGLRISDEPPPPENQLALLNSAF